jgi:16S rRNA G1207 methylase RsmC
VEEVFMFTVIISLPPIKAGKDVDLKGNGEFLSSL